ncbi:MAG: hypothetical protein KAH72_02980 [Flavobacteriaceae bacterium]|nr:hypothetical protein [Flavobacteriaceae bacterium]
MEKKYTLRFILILLFLFITNSFYSQTQSSQKDYYKWFDNYIGIENTSIFNGLRYKEEFRTLEGNHKFYLTPNFIKADIVYDDQSYFDIKMKYDLYEDHIIVNLATNSGSSILQLLSDKIESFTIKGHNFIKLLDNHTTNSNDIITGIFEIVYKNSNLILYKKNKKIAKKHLTKKYIYYSFSKKNQYYFYFNNDFYIINSKSSVVKIFPNYKKEINTFYNKNKNLLNSDFDAFIMQLSVKISNLISSNTSAN